MDVRSGACRHEKRMVVNIVLGLGPHAQKSRLSFFAARPGNMKEVGWQNIQMSCISLGLHRCWGSVVGKPAGKSAGKPVEPAGKHGAFLCT
jgi:hypothetical protein